MTEEKEIVRHEVRLEPDEHRFHSIYEPVAAPHSGARPAFAMQVRHEVLLAHPVDLADVHARPDGWVQLRSYRRPEVGPWLNGPNDAPVLVDQLVMQLHRLDARNLHRDNVFVGRRLVVRVREEECQDGPWYMGRPVGPLRLLRLECVWIEVGP